MFRLKWMTVPALVTMLLLFGACGVIAGSGDASRIADEFYRCQQSPNNAIPSDFFSDQKIATQAERLISRRSITYGAYVSHKRTGTNRRISFESHGRTESITYIFEVTGENGTTRETLMLSRSHKSDPFHISAYIIENIPYIQNPALVDTNSA